MKKKGFTLIELLAVIIILAVIALIATPVVLNVVDNAKKNANKNSVYGLIDGAKLYYADSLLDTNKSNNTNGTTNLIDEIKVSGTKPDSGYLYINSKGETALAVVYDNVCYTKNFSDNDLKESDDIKSCNINSYKCVRATQLHQETCEKDKGFGCNSMYDTGSTITYGNENVTSGVLASGDAFDCDVNGDGIYDPETERFYYVSDYYNTSTKSFDNDYAVLIYYNNTVDGLPNNSYNSLDLYERIFDFDNLGPNSLLTYLPTISQWSNVELRNNGIRTILNELGGNTTRLKLFDNDTSSYVETEFTLPSKYNYSIEVDGVSTQLAARLLTTQELEAGCNITVNVEDLLDTCEYLSENTQYSGGYISYSYWLETAISYDNKYIGWNFSGIRRNLDMEEADDAPEPLSGSVRPVIEVLKTDIEIEF